MKLSPLLNFLRQLLPGNLPPPRVFPPLPAPRHPAAMVTPRSPRSEVVIPEPIEPSAAEMPQLIAKMAPDSEYECLDANSAKFDFKLNIFDRAYESEDGVSAAKCELYLIFGDGGWIPLDLVFTDVTQGLAVTSRFGVIKVKGALWQESTTEDGAAPERIGGYRYFITSAQRSLLDSYVAALLDPQNADFHDKKQDHAKAVELDPTVADYHFHNGKMLCEQGKFLDAIDSHSKAIKLKLGRPLYFYERGKCHAAIKQWAKALADYSEAIRLAPSFYDAYLARAYAYKGAGDEEKAGHDYYRFESLDPYSEWNR